MLGCSTLTRVPGSAVAHTVWGKHSTLCNLAVALKRIDDNKVESTMKKAGTPVMTVGATVSPDGKTRGQDVNNTRDAV